jgi:hypothetical protein
MALDRTTLPSEFYDLTEAQLLVQPEPQYFYCQLFKAALGIELGVAGVMAGHWRDVPAGGGADYGSAERDRLLLSSPLPSALFQVKYNFRGGPGHTVKFNRPQFANTTYTAASRQVKTNQTISTTPIEVGGEQNTLTIKRFAGPYDATNSRVAPLAFDAFDAAMGVHELYRIGGVQLKRDFDRFIDTYMVAQADEASTAVYPEGMTAVNDPTAAGQFPLTYEQMSRAAKEMDEANLPTLPDGKRCFVVTPTGKKQLKDDPQFARYVEFHAEKNPLMGSSWFGSCPEFHCFVSTTLAVTNNSSSVPIHYGHAIAPGAFMAGMGRPPQVRTASEDNYGESPRVIWLADLCAAPADVRFIKSIRYTADAQ